jgi:hypothetical protein
MLVSYGLAWFDIKMKPHGSSTRKTLVRSSVNVLKVSTFFAFETYGVVVLFDLLRLDALQVVLSYVGKPLAPKSRPKYLLLHHPNSGLLA